MDAHLTFELENLEKELKDIRYANNGLIASVDKAWQGEDAKEFVHILSKMSEHVADIESQLRNLSQSMAYLVNPHP